MSYLASATDLASTLSSILVEAHKSDPIDPHVSFKTLDSFLLEAKQINKSIRDLLSYIRAIRTPYLSTAPPPRRNQKHGRTTSQIQTALGTVPTYMTDLQREDVTSQTNALLRDLRDSIENLRTAANIQHQTVQKRLESKYGKSTNFLLRWAAGGNDAGVGDAGKTEERVEEEGREDTVYRFRNDVLYYLRFWYEKVWRSQYDMVETWSERQREKAASMLYDERNRNVKLQRNVEDVTGVDGDASYSNMDMRGRDKYNPALDPYGGEVGQELSPEQLQLFEEENSSLAKHYNDQLNQVTQVEKSLLEISSMQQTIQENLEVQGEMVSSLVVNAERTDENVQRGNKELKRATEKTRIPKILYHTTLYLCAGLIVWDLIF
ncbi:syntaxin ufe1 [Knufia obscura]|uniref:Syntaxin ufe1 n=2 Tax=Knufia TaxID=430999 RepID=A0AAN8ENS4_9EURO|nr:syntaxin ufe1 [Knufia obscura]KAK5948883.1 syntaxin ufe1 [Knufia fluminis]